MTLKECQEAARRGVKVRHTVLGVGATYDRIGFVGYRYENGKEYQTVRLLDMCGHSVTDAHPFDVQLEEYVRAAEMANEQKGDPNVKT